MRRLIFSRALSLFYKYEIKTFKNVLEFEKLTHFEVQNLLARSVVFLFILSRDNIWLKSNFHEPD